MPSQQPHELAALLAEGRQLAKRRPSSGQNRIAAASAEGRAPSAPTEGRPPRAPQPEARPSVRAPEEPARVARPVPAAPAPVARPVAAEPAPEGPSGGGRGRPTPTLQPTWIDPEETPFVPVPRPGKALPSRLFSLAVAVGLVALLAWLILPEVSFRIGHARTVRVSDGVLSAQPVQLAPTEAATVEELLVDPRRLPDAALPAGTPIARLKVSTPDAFGSDTQELSVPFDARFVSIDTLPGGVTQPGTPVATVYDPGQMEVIMTVSAGGARQPPPGHAGHALERAGRGRGRGDRHLRGPAPRHRPRALVQQAGQHPHPARRRAGHGPGARDPLRRHHRPRLGARGRPSARRLRDRQRTGAGRRLDRPPVGRRVGGVGR